ncbi:PREDICTED: E3 ubiquitin-protein ligase TM129 [Nicrophorus vespilloides]|uniref:E3 ubiquitin-protein ligase TM129 n=1 Tax=Nicrophorus vespilloides TaxID=110193 RepID=A0ABM1MQ16_NICVS|nr:PREDICTED: E3 ubiquitin-protein ligase TM129 [Nicrophorus vespilloides]
MTADVVFLLFYLLFAFCVIFPPTECISFGFTIPQLFSSILGSEHENFIEYHMKRTAFTLLIYSVLPLGFIFGTTFFGDENGIQKLWFVDDSIWISVLLSLAIILPILAFFEIVRYKLSWENHAIVKTLKKFTTGNRDWRMIAQNINFEFRSIDKLCVQTNAIIKIVATENWIIKVTPLSMCISHQSDSQLCVRQSDTHAFSHLSNDGTQFITIEVQSPRVPSYNIRLNTLDFRDLQDRLAGIVHIPENIKIFKSVIEKFVDAFRHAVEQNPKYKTSQDLDHCFGCNIVTSNVKLQKLCEDSGEEHCSNCNCRPIWCVDCLARWFAHQQDIEQTSQWLSGKCPCPMCKKRFCLLDVCMVEQIE